MWKTLTHVEKYKDPWVTTWSDDMEFPDGHKSTYGYLEFKDGAHVVVIDKDSKIVLFKQFRYPINKKCWSIPGGRIDTNETPEQAAKREAEEEIHIKISSIEQLGKTWHFCGAFISERHYFFLAHTDGTASNGGENNELITNAQSFTTDEVLDMIDSGEIEENYVANALQIAIRKIEKNI